MSSRQEIIQRVQESQEQIRVLGVCKLSLFGSFVREEQTLDSDVDLLVEFQPGQKSFDHFMALAFLLEDLLQRRVELVTLESLSSYLRTKILSEAQPVLDFQESLHPL